MTDAEYFEVFRQNFWRTVSANDISSRNFLAGSPQRFAQGPQRSSQ